jgi:translation initiation factor IF-1
MGKPNKGSEQKQTKVSVDGIVIEVLPDTKYKIEIQVGGMKHALIGYPSGKIRKNYIKLAEGDEVIVEIDPEYDLEKGRVVWKKNKLKPGMPGAELPKEARQPTPEIKPEIEHKPE